MTSPDKLDLVTPRTRMRLELENLKSRSSEHDEIKAVYHDLKLVVQLPNGESVTKEVSVGESVANVKYAVCEGRELDYSKTRLFLMPKHEPMMELLSLNDFTLISGGATEVTIQAELIE